MLPQAGANRFVLRPRTQVLALRPSTILLQRLRRTRQPIQMHVHVRPIPLHTDQLQIAAKVPRIEPTDGQAVAEARHGRLEIALVELRVDGRGRVDGRVHVRPDERDRRARDPAALVRDLDGDILFALGDDDFCDGELGLLLPVKVDDGAEGVFEGLEKHMRKVAGDVHEIEVVSTHELDLGRLEQAVIVFAYEARVLDRFGREVLDVRLCADDADIVGVAVGARVLEGDVLADEHADADAGHVEAVEECLDGVVDLHALALALIFEDTLRDGGDDAVVAALDAFECGCEPLVVICELGRPVAVIIQRCEVPSCSTSCAARAIRTITIAIGALISLEGGVLCSAVEGPVTARYSCGFCEALFDVCGEAWAGEGGDFFE